MTLEIDSEKIDNILQTLSSRDYETLFPCLEEGTKSARYINQQFHFPFLEEPPILTFLKKLYVPRNIDDDSRKYVADKILSIDYDQSIVNSEMLFAKKAEDDVRFRDLAEKSIDHHVSHDFYRHLKYVIIKWEDPELADYAIEKMTSELSGDEKNLEDMLECCEDIAQAFGTELDNVMVKEEAEPARLRFYTNVIKPIVLLVLEKFVDQNKHDDDSFVPDLNIFGIESRDGWYMAQERYYDIVSPARMQRKICEKADPSIILQSFEHYINYSGDKRTILRNMRIDYLASIGEYKDASKFALELVGLDMTSYFSEFFKTSEYYFDLSQTYLAMQNSVDAVKVFAE